MGLASGKVKVRFGSAMNCKNARLEGEMIRFDCPSCGVDADLDEATLDKLWLEYQGQVTCPLPQGCNTQYTIPTKTELDGLRAATVAAAMGLYWLVMALRGYRAGDDQVWAKKVFIFSIFTITALSIMMSIDFQVTETEVLMTSLR